MNSDASGNSGQSTVADQSDGEVYNLRSGCRQHSGKARKSSITKSTAQEETLSINEAIPDPAEPLAEIPVINMEHFSAVSMEDKLALLMTAINKINTNFHYKFNAFTHQLAGSTSSILPRLEKFEQQQEVLDARLDEVEKSHTETAATLDQITTPLQTYKEDIAKMEKRVEKLELTVSKLQDDLTITKGVLQVHDKSLMSNADKLVDLTARSMSNNITISGISGDCAKDEKCKPKVLDFFKDNMKMEVREEEVLVAHRLGKWSIKASKPRLMVVRCSQSLRDRVFQFTSNLKGQKNDKNDFYFVKPQLPEPLFTQKKEREEQIKVIKLANANIPDNESDKRTKYEICDKTLFVNGKPQKKYIHPPTVQDILNVDKFTQEKMDTLKNYHTVHITDKENVFQGHAYQVRSNEEVNLAYKKIRTLFPEADNIPMAYTFNSLFGHHDDNEHGAGSKMRKILLDRGVRGVAVFVTRIFSGIHIGQRRYVHIEQLTRQALDLLQSDVGR